MFFLTKIQLKLHGVRGLPVYAPSFTQGKYHGFMALWFTWASENRVAKNPSITHNKSSLFFNNCHLGCLAHLQTIYPMVGWYIMIYPNVFAYPHSPLYPTIWVNLITAELCSPEAWNHGLDIGKSSPFMAARFTLGDGWYQNHGYVLSTNTFW